jgi:nicotinamide-nucleotide amidase
VVARLGDAVWGADDDELAGLAIATLRARGQRLAVVERGTGGALASALSAADPDATALAGAVVAWQVDAMDTLQGSAAALQRGSAAQAAAGARAFFAADAAIAVGELRPVDGEDGGAEVDVAVRDATGDETITVRLPERSGPWVRDRVVLRALDLLRRRLRDAR